MTEPPSAQSIIARAAEHGTNVFRTLLEDDGEPYEDALRIGMQTAAAEAIRLEEAGRGHG